MRLQQIVANLQVGSIRREEMLGRNWIVAPITMIVPGVLNGSKGKLYYPLDEIGKDYDAWNYMPITVYHPTRNGRPVSAREPDILEKQSVGHVLRSKVKNSLK